MNRNQFKNWFIRIENNASRLILIHSDWKFTSDSNESESRRWRVDLNRILNPHESELIRNCFIPIENNVSRLILIHSDWKFSSDSFGFIRIEVSNWIGLNLNYSESFRYLNPRQCESIRTNPKKVLNLVCWKTLEN